MSSADRTRRYRKRRGRGRPSDVAWMVLVPVTFDDVNEMVRLRLLSDGCLDKPSVTAAVRKLWLQLEVEKTVTRDAQR